MTMTAKNVTPTADEAILAKEASRLLARLGDGDSVVDVELKRGQDTLSLRLPPSVIRVLLDALVNLGDGRPVTVVGQDTELGTIEAAKFLGVSRPFFVELLKNEKIKHHMVGTHRRVYFSDLVAFKASDDEERRNVLAELTRETQDMKLL
jgi:excisionase family DNA binding protein